MTEPSADRSTERDAEPGAGDGSGSEASVRPASTSLPVLVVSRAQRVSEALPVGAPAISADGRYVAFVSESGSLVEGDHNGAADVFVRDTLENRTVLVSRSRFGGSAAGCSLQPSISADGRVVAFTSSAPDLVPGDSNGTLDVFVHDLGTGVTELVSRGSNGELADHDSFSPSLSADGRFVAFSSLADNLDPRDRNNSPDIYRHDRQTRRTTLISVSLDGLAGNGPSGQPSISADGRLVAFTSAATDLGPADDNAAADVYLRDVESGASTLVSRALDGTAGDGSSSEPVISADGSTIAFTSSAADLVRGDDNAADDVFVHRVGEPGARLVSTSADPKPGDERGGRSASGASHAPSVSADGQRVAFLSTGSDGHEHGYLQDAAGAGTALVGFAAGRVPGDGETTAVVVSGSGGTVAFSDTSTDLAGQPAPRATTPSTVERETAQRETGETDQTDQTGPDGDGDGEQTEQLYVADVSTAAVPGPGSSQA